MQIRRFTTLDEIRSIPGYVEHIRELDNQEPKFIGYYRFRDYIHCAKADCNQAHGYGYAVRTADGREVAIGNVCGRELFGELWEAAARNYDKAVERHMLELSLSEQLASLPGQLAKASALLTSRHGAKWFQEAEFSLRRACPKYVIEKIYDRARRRDTLVTVSRLRSDDDPPGSPPVIHEPRGQLQGLGAFGPASARQLLDQLLPDVKFFANETVGSLMGRPPLRTRFSSWHLALDANIRIVEAQLAEARVFYETDNLRLLQHDGRDARDRDLLSRLTWNEESGQVEIDRAAA